MMNDGRSEYMMNPMSAEGIILNTSFLQKMKRKPPRVKPPGT